MHSVERESFAVNPGADLLEAAQAALKLLDRIDAHAPSDMHFGGEGKVRKQLRTAIRLAEAGGTAPDPWDYETSAAFEEAEALHEEQLLMGRAMSAREREAFLRGFREARAALRG